MMEGWGKRDGASGHLSMLNHWSEFDIWTGTGMVVMAAK